MILPRQRIKAAGSLFCVHKNLPLARILMAENFYRVDTLIIKRPTSHPSPSSLNSGLLSDVSKAENECPCR